MKKLTLALILAGINALPLAAQAGYVLRVPVATPTANSSNPNPSNPNPAGPQIGNNPGYAVFSSDQSPAISSSALWGTLGAVGYAGGAATCPMRSQGSGFTLNLSSPFVLKPDGARSGAEAYNVATTSNPNYYWYVAGAGYNSVTICVPVPDYTILPNASSSPFTSDGSETPTVSVTPLWSGGSIPGSPWSPPGNGYSYWDSAVVVDLTPYGGVPYMFYEMKRDTLGGACDDPYNSSGFAYAYAGPLSSFGYSQSNVDTHVLGTTGQCLVNISIQK